VDALDQYAWIGALLFSRLGSALMLAPGWGEAAIPVTFRLSAAVLATAALAPALATSAPPMPTTVAAGIPFILTEILIGLILGGGARILMSALQVAGVASGLASGLGFAQQVDPTINQPSAIFSAFFSLVGVVLVMSAGLHRLMIEAAAESYQVFPAGSMPPIGAAADLVLRAVADAFRLGLQIAAPVLVFSVVFNLALGLASRLVPQVQIYLVAMPLSVLLSVAVIALGFGAGMMVWIEAMDREVRQFIP
jgi:flagellar biosynthesis protein FliR